MSDDNPEINEETIEIPGETIDKPEADAELAAEAEVEAPAAENGAAAAPVAKAKTTNRFRRPRRKVCLFCVEKAETIDYKQIWQPKYARLLLTERGRIVPRRTRGLCAKHQRMVARAIKRARHMALLPFVVK